MSNTLLTASEAIYQRFVDNYTATPYVFDNEIGGTLDQGATSWVRLSVRELGLDEQTMGNAGSRKFRRSGIIIVQTFSPVDAGVATLQTLCETIRTIFEGVRFSGIESFSSRVRDIGTDGKWRGAIVEINFSWTETK